jgi:hypothetical protein
MGHRALSPRGSGADIAAAVYGGTLLFQLAEPKPIVTDLAWPEGAADECESGPQSALAPVTFWMSCFHLRKDILPATRSASVDLSEASQRFR